ncbi:MAG: glycosyltransferase [Bacteroidota bacterium]
MIVLFFYIFALLHLVHLIRLYTSLQRYKAGSNTNYPAFSVIIAAKNEIENLKKLLPLILEQQYPEIEIVVALDRCDDGSLEYVKSLKNSKIKVVDINELATGFSGKKNALTQAIKYASHEWLLFTDADCRPNSKHWIQSFAAKISDTTSILIGVSPYNRMNTLLNQFIQYETLYTALKYTAATIRKETYMGVGRNLAYRKSIFLAGSGYYPYEMLDGGDDDLFVQKHATPENTEVVFGQNSLTFSSPKTNLKDYLKQKTRHIHIGKFYKGKNLHVYWTTTHTMLWLCFIYLIFTLPLNVGVILTFALLLILKGLIFNLSSRKLGYKYNPVYLPISDLIFGILYPIIGVRALLLRKVKWN